MTTKSTITVTIQLICIAALVLTGPVIPQHTAPLALACVGIAIILWAVASMGIYNVRVEPDLHEHAQLVTSGPYRLVRHPMYTGGTLITLAWALDKPGIIRILAAVVLFADFLVKLNYEERLLNERFPSYAEYAHKSKRLVPFVY